jgi:hypothetical protein
MHGWFDLDAIGNAGPSSARELDVRDFPNAALISTAFAAGGMTSTLADLLAWAEALYLGEWLSPAMRALLFKSTAVADLDGVGRGLGVVGYGEQAADGSWSAYGHAGNIVGSSTFIAAFPGSGTTVALHANVQEVARSASSSSRSRSRRDAYGSRGRQRGISAGALARRCSTAAVGRTARLSPGGSSTVASTMRQ